MEPFVAETLKSVVAQKSPHDEYIFIDGASDDRTLEIAQGYEAGIDRLISEPDEGQYDAIAKGMALATGDIMGWINADDILMPSALATVREIFESFPEVDWITGAPSFLNHAGTLVRIQGKLPAYVRRYIANGWHQKTLGAYLQQESMFWRRSLWERAGGLNLDLKLAADFDLWTRFAQHSDLVPVDIPLAAFRERPGQQRSSIQETAYLEEVAAVCASKPPAPRLWHLIGESGLVLRNAARLLISAKGPAICYDRQAQCWVKITRRRSISRTSLSMLWDEWKMLRSRT